jgi:hypothetical protein
MDALSPNKDNHNKYSASNLPDRVQRHGRRDYRLLNDGTDDDGELEANGPRLSRAVRDYLTLLAAEVSCERLFSRGRDISGLRSHRLAGDRDGYNHVIISVCSLN